MWLKTTPKKSTPKRQQLRIEGGAGKRTFLEKHDFVVGVSKHDDVYKSDGAGAEVTPFSKNNAKGTSKSLAYGGRKLAFGGAQENISEARVGGTRALATKVVGNRDDVIELGRGKGGGTSREKLMEKTKARLENNRQKVIEIETNIATKEADAHESSARGNPPVVWLDSEEGVIPNRDICGVCVEEDNVHDDELVSRMCNRAQRHLEDGEQVKALGVYLNSLDKASDQDEKEIHRKIAHLSNELGWLKEIEDEEEEEEMVVVEEGEEDDDDDDDDEEEEERELEDDDDDESQGDEIIVL